MNFLSRFEVRVLFVLISELWFCSVKVSQQFCKMIGSQKCTRVAFYAAFICSEQSMAEILQNTADVGDAALKLRV